MLGANARETRSNKTGKDPLDGVRNGIDGFIVKYDDIDGMCRRIEELACSADKRREMGLLSAE